jgi:tetratricopeptide (TPR) repeat protein
MIRSLSVQNMLKQAVDFHRAGRLADAERVYRDVLRRDPSNGDALNLLGVIARAQGRATDALACFDRAIAAHPGMAPAYYNRSSQLADAGRVPEAIEDLRRAVSLVPTYADARLNYGALLQRGGDIPGAVTEFKEMTARCPKDARGHYNLGRCLVEQGELSLAEASLLVALGLDPTLKDALITLAKLYADTNRVTEAIDTVKRALNIDPGDAKALTNLGTYLTYVDDHAAALSAYDKALAFDANNQNAKVNRALTRLTLGRLAEGWDDYDDRADSDGSYRFRKLDLPFPRWSGEPLAGKRMFLWGEQGLGDEILGAGMVGELGAAGHCTLACSARLVALFRRSFPAVDVVSLEPVLKELLPGQYDYHASLLDLGRWRRRGFGAFPNRGSYLNADAARAADVRARLQSQFGRRRLIGFSWRSFAAHVGTQKTPPLEAWTPLFAQHDAGIVNMQYGSAESLHPDLIFFRARWPDAPVVGDASSISEDIDALASRVQAMDLVVTVSNSLAHLAGALGVPCLVAVPNRKARLWYWFTSGAFSPWYSSLRTWRWAEVGEEELQAVLAA